SIITLPPPRSTLFPYTTLFRSRRAGGYVKSRHFDFGLARLTMRASAERHCERTDTQSRRAGHRALQGGAWQRARYSISARLQRIDRKSTRLNSSHVSISYAVFC